MNRRAKTMTIAALIALIAAGRISMAAENLDSVRKGPLKLPSAPGPHIEKIRAMADNSWLSLGSPAPDPDWGKARGRAWTPHMGYAPELLAGFLHGQGVHAWCNKQNNRFMDDFFVYDINANRWICIYPGTDIKTVSMKMDANGFEVDDAGDPFPIAQLAHAWELVSYDTERRRFMFVPRPSGDWLGHFGERRKAWGGYKWPFVPPQASPWMYDTGLGKFQLFKVKGPSPGTSSAGVAGYLPGNKKFIYWISGNQVWNYDIASNAWASIKAKGPLPPFGSDAAACVDSKRDRIYMGGGYSPVAPLGSNALWCYDGKTDTWVDLQPKGTPCKGCNRYGPTHAVMNYDSVNDAVVLFYHVLPASPADGPANPAGTAALGIYIYDPAANTWSEKPLSMPPELDPAKHSYCYSSFYSPELNTHFIHAANDSTDDGVMWVYRYKRAGK